MNLYNSKFIDFGDNEIRFRNHPLYIFSGTLPLIVFLGTIIFNIIKKVFEDKDGFSISKLIANLTKKISPSFLLIILLIFLAFVIFTIFRYYLLWKNTTISLSNTSIVSKKYGLILKKDKTSLINKVTNVNINTNVFLNIFSVSKVTIDINSAETFNTFDYVIYLPNDISYFFRDSIKNLQNDMTIKDIILHINKNTTEKDIDTTHNDTILFERRFSVSDLIIHTLLDSGILYSIFMMIISRSNKTLFAIFSITSIFSLIKGIVKIFVKYYNFKIAKYKDHLSISYGLINKEEFVLDSKSIISYGIKENFLSKILGYQLVNLDIIGYGNSGDETKYASLFMKKSKIDEYVKNIGGDIKTNENTYIKKPRTLYIYYFIRSFIFIFLPSVIVYIGFPKFYIPVIGFFICFVTSYIALIYSEVKICSDCIVIKRGVFSKSIENVPYKKIESVGISYSPISKYFGVSNLNYAIRDSTVGKKIDSTGLFHKEIFEEIVQFYKNGEA